MIFTGNNCHNLSRLRASGTWYRAARYQSFDTLHRLHPQITVNFISHILHPTSTTKPRTHKNRVQKLNTHLTENTVSIIDIIQLVPSRETITFYCFNYKKQKKFHLWILRKWDLGARNGSIWLRIETGGGHLWMR